MSIKIMICEDNDALRHSIKILLGLNEGFEVVADLADGIHAAEKVAILKPDIVIMDIDMPLVNGIDAVRQVKEISPGTAIIMFTQFGDDQRLFDSLCAGASGYILKKENPDKLTAAILEVLNGGAPMSPSIAKKVLGTFHGKGVSFPVRYGLTDRETEVLNLLAKGYGIKQIGTSLFISYETARSHLRNIYHKLHVNCGKEAIAKILSEQIH